MIEDKDVVGLHFDAQDIDQVFKATKNPRILQDISRNLDNLKDILFTTVDKGDPLFDTKAVCECGVTTARQSSSDVCPVCFSTIEAITSRSMTPTLYLGKPVGVSGFITPYIYHALRNAFDIGTNANPYNPFVALMGNQGSSNPIHKVIKNRIPSKYYGYNNILKDLPGFLTELCDATFDIIYPKEKGIIASHISKAHKDKKNIVSGLFEARDLAKIYEEYEIPHMSQVLPIRPKLLMTLEEGTYSTTSTTTDLYGKAIVYAHNMPYGELDMSEAKSRNWRPDSSMTKFYEKLADFRALYYKEEGSKGGGMRTDSIVSRSGSVLRSVQTQNCNIHRGEDLLLPYSQSIIIYHQHIVAWYQANKKWSADKIINFIEDNLRVYHEELWSVVNNIVKEISKMGGIAYSVRFPSIYRTSGLCKDISGVKKDPEDRTLSVAASSLPASAGDFDGDKITVHVVFIKKVAEAYERLRVSKAALDLSKEGKYAKFVSLPQSTVQMWSNYTRGIDHMKH